MINNAKYIFIGLLYFILCEGCKKESQNNTNGAPAGFVDAYISITANPALNAVNGWAYINGGVRGVLVYRKTITDFMAYERDCPYQPNNTCALIKADPGGILAVDSCCGSKFLMTDGSVNKGPATIPLTRYQVTFDGTNTLHIFN